MTADLAIEVRGLVKRFGGVTAVDGIDLAVPKGSIFGFLGANGSGKTTTIRMLCGLLRPDGGTGTCLGLDITRDADAIRRRVGYMTQAFSLYVDMTVLENLRFVADLYGVDRPGAAIDRIVERMGLGERRRQMAGTLSGGWKQRLALACAVLHEPDLLLLDEPTAGVDPAARRAFWQDIHRFAADGMTALVTTHYMDEAERCHLIAYMARGRVVTHGTVAAVLAGAGLSTWEVRPRIETGTTAADRALAELTAALEGTPGVETVAAFGSTLHVSGRDAARLEAAIGPFRTRPDLDWRPSEPDLEDVFITLAAPSPAAGAGDRP